VQEWFKVKPEMFILVESGIYQPLDEVH